MADQGQNKQFILPGEPILLYVEGKDECALYYAYLSTNESGEWKNYTNLLEWQYAKKITFEKGRITPDFWSETIEDLPLLVTIKPEHYWWNSDKHCADFAAHAQKHCPIGNIYLAL